MADFYYKMEYDAWDEGTVDLSLEEEAAYLRVCHQIYRRKQPMPQSAKLLCAIWRCHPNKAKKLLQALLEKGKILLTAEGHLTNNRVGRELDARGLKVGRLAVAGRLGGTQSGVVRGNTLKLLDPPEANASTQRSREDEIRGDDRKEKDGADAPSLGLDIPIETKQKSAEDQAKKELYAECNKLFNGSGGGMATKLLRAKAGNIWQAMAALGAAKESGDPRSYIGGIIKKTEPYSPIM